MRNVLANHIHPGIFAVLWRLSLISTIT